MLPALKLDGLKPSSLRRPVYVSAFPFTHHRVKLRVFRQPAREIDTRSQRWFLTDALRAIPIIALSAHAMLGDEQRALQSGCDDYLSKPLDEALLFAKLARFLGQA